MAPLRILFLFTLVFPHFLSAQSNHLDTLPEPIIEFIGSASSPDFGAYNTSAPLETLQFGQLAGLWSVETHAYSNGQWYSGWPALWAFKYILDGYGIQDLWFTEQQNLSPPLAHLQRDYIGTNIRVYDPNAEQWMVTWCTNQGDQLQSDPCHSLHAKLKHRVIEMRPNEQDEDRYRRVLFQDIADSTFTWVSEISVDQGKTWQPRLRLEAMRLK